MASVGEDIFVELQRNRKLRETYGELGPAGRFGYICIGQDIAEAETALAAGDIVEVLRSFEKLKANK